MAEPEGNTELLKCTQCGHTMGVIHHIGDYDILQLGGSMTKHHDGACEKCGYGFHWHVSDQSLERLVKHVLDLLAGTGV